MSESTEDAETAAAPWNSLPIDSLCETTPLPASENGN